MQTLPEARKDRLVVEELLDELLVYDLDRNKAHCLNQTSAIIWRNCDGRRSVRELAKLTEETLAISCDEGIVWLALDQLSRKHLLKTQSVLPPEMLGMSRRRMVRNLGIAAAVAVPLITSLVAPTAVQAGTCLASGQPCAVSTQCCSNLCTPGINTCA